MASTYDTGSTYDTVQFSGGFDLRTKFDVADLPAPVRQAFGWSTGRSSSPVRSAARPTLLRRRLQGTDAERVRLKPAATQAEPRDQRQILQRLNHD